MTCISMARSCAAFFLPSIILNEISDTATSLRMIDGRKFDKKILMKKIVDEFFYLYVHYYNEGKLREIIKLWKSRCDTIGKNVHVISKTNELIGKAVGI